MIQEELVREIAADTNLKQGDVKAVIEYLGYQLAKIRPGEEIRTTTIGTFSVTRRAARQGRNPQTGESVEIEARNVMAFKPAKHVRDGING